MIGSANCAYSAAIVRKLFLKEFGNINIVFSFALEMKSSIPIKPFKSLVRVRIDESKLTATEINPYAGKNGKKMDSSQFEQCGGVVNGEFLTINDYHQKYAVAEMGLREFVIRQYLVANGGIDGDDAADKYTIEEYGSFIQSNKLYEAGILESGGIILLSQ